MTRILRRLFHCLAAAVTFVRTGGRSAVSSYNANTDFVAASKQETTLAQPKVFVGVSNISFAEAMNNAWEVAKGNGVPSGTRFKVLEQTATGVNPFTDFRVTIISL